MAVEKVSVSLDADVLAQTRERVGGRGVSGYINQAVRRQLRRDALNDVVHHLRETDGPVDPKRMEEVRRSWPGPDEQAASRPA